MLEIGLQKGGEWIIVYVIVYIIIFFESVNIFKGIKLFFL